MSLRTLVLPATLAMVVAVGLMPGQSRPDGKQIVEAALAALGGDNFLHLQSREARGRVYSFFRDEMSGGDRARTLLQYVEPVGKDELAVRERQWFGKKQDYSYLFLPNQAWELTFRGARPMEDDQLAKYQRTTRNDILYILRVRHNEPGMTFDFISSDVEITRHVEIVELTDAQGQVVRVSFDHNTHLPVRQSFQWLDPVTRERNDEVTEFDKYRDIGSGVQWPFTIQRSRNGYKVFQVFADSVQGNVPVPSGTFDLPSGAKILRK